MAGGQELLKALKATATANAPCLVIPVGSPVEATLRPVATIAGSLRASDVRVLTEWRDRFVKAFLTEFKADEERTARWLTEMVGPDDTRILFMLDDAAGRTFGYMGLAFIDWENSYGEADSVVRGREAAHGIMARALHTLLSWSRTQLSLQHLGVRVRSDNSALEFYRKLGFKEERRVALRRVAEADSVRWVEDESLDTAESSLVYMSLPDWV